MQVSKYLSNYKAPLTLTGMETWLRYSIMNRCQTVKHIFSAV